MDWAQRQGLESFGVDVDDAAISAAKDRGLKIGSPDDLRQMLESRQVDAITMWDVIEHVFDPHSFMTQAVEHLKPGGIVALETPDGAFPVRDLARGLDYFSKGRIGFAGAMYYWEHKIYFTEEGLRRLLAAHGCEIVDVVRLTSPRAKMQRTFAHNAQQDLSLTGRALSVGWPVAETVFRRLGWGNKLIVLARRTR